LFQECNLLFNGWDFLKGKNLNSQLSFLFFIIALLLICCISCDTAEPPDNKFKLEDVSCTEAWITLTTNNLPLPATITLKQTNPNGDTKSQILNLNTKDSLLYIDSLLPNQTYKCKVSSIQQQVSSNELSVTTLDTTSQNFSFEILEFGDGFESSYFNDVWVFDENNIWAVGYISPSDTIVNGTPIINPNIIRWNGIKWELEPFDGTSSGIDGIWAVNPSLIYFAFGNILKYQNGVYEHIIVPGNWQMGQRIEKLWGSSESNIYGVGPWGTIVWYNGVKWTKIEYDTQWYFYEITGNKETGVGYAVAINQSSDCIVVKLENSATEIFYRQLTSDIKIHSVTLTELNNFLYIPNDWQNTICRISEKTGKVEVIHQITGSFGMEQSSAVSSNDIYFFGPDYSGIGVWLLHFNGIRYKTLEIPSVDRDNLGSLHAIKDLAVSVGFTNNKAYIIKIRR